MIDAQRSNVRSINSYVSSWHLWTWNLLPRKGFRTPSSLLHQHSVLENESARLENQPQHQKTQQKLGKKQWEWKIKSMTFIVCCNKKLKELLTFSNLGNQKPLFFPMQFVYQDPLRPWEKVLVAVAWHNEPAKSPTYPSPKAIRWITLGTVGWTPRNHQHASVPKYSYPQTTSTLPCFLGPGLLPRFCLTFQLWDCQTPCRGGTIMETEALPSIDGERVGWLREVGSILFFPWSENMPNL